MKTQEIWFTVRLKGYANTDADVGSLAKHIADCLPPTFYAPEGTFNVTQNPEVIEIEEEASIYAEEPTRF